LSQRLIGTKVICFVEHGKGYILDRAPSYKTLLADRQGLRSRVGGLGESTYDFAAAG